MPHDTVNTYLHTIIVAVLLSCTTNSALGKTQRHDSDKTVAALAALFIVSGERVVPGSSCDLIYHPEPRPVRVGFMLAVAMSNLDIGKNTVYGSCKGNKCSVEIYHAYGEDVSAAVIRFRTKNGKARVETMECILTP